MKIRVLGCHGGELPGHRTTCFLLDGRLCIDGGSITNALPLDEILRIDDIFLTHSHFDHVKDLPLLADLIVGRRDKPVMVYSSTECIKTLKANVFNNELWPDFTAIPNKKNPTTAMSTEPGLP